MVTIFDHGDEPYQPWLAANPDGWVINSGRSITPDYLVLHSAGCSSIRNYHDRAKPGGYTERSFIKICSTELSDPSAWVRSHGRPGGSFSKRCGLCT